MHQSKHLVTHSFSDQSHTSIRALDSGSWTARSCGMVPSTEHLEMSNVTAAVSEVKQQFGFAVHFQKKVVVNLSELPFSEQVSEIRKLFGFDQNEFAKQLAVPMHELVLWENSGRSVAPQYAQTAKSIRKLALLIGAIWRADKLSEWVEKPRKELDGLSPKQAIRRKGGLFFLLDRFSVYY